MFVTIFLKIDTFLERRGSIWFEYFRLCLHMNSVVGRGEDQPVDRAQVLTLPLQHLDVHLEQGSIVGVHEVC